MYQIARHMHVARARCLQPTQCVYCKELGAVGLPVVAQRDETLSRFIIFSCVALAPTQNINLESIHELRQRADTDRQTVHPAATYVQGLQAGALPNGVWKSMQRIAATQVENPQVMQRAQEGQVGNAAACNCQLLQRRAFTKVQQL